MAIEYGKDVQENYGLTSDELYKADVTVAALLNGYLLKEGTSLGQDKVSFFAKFDNNKHVKSFVMSEGELSETDKQIIDWNMKTGGKAIDESYFANIVSKKNPITIQTLVDYTKAKLLDNNEKDSDNVKNYYANRLALVSNLNKNKQVAGESGR